MCDPRYSTNARTLYSILVTYADTQVRNTRRGKPYRKELAAQMGVSVSTVDRTLVEMEVAGMVTVEERRDPANPTNNEANVFHLHDAPLMWQGNGEWKDPLPSGVKAAEVAKQVIEARRAEKRAQGVERRGGVPKGVNPKAVKAAREGSSKDAEEGAGSTDAARGSSTDAASRAARALRNIQSPHQTPAPEPSSSTDGRRPSTGSRGSRAGGSAASSNTKPTFSRTQRRQYDAFVAALPAPLKALVPNGLPKPLVDAVLTSLDHDNPAGRTVEQLVEYRLMPKWDKYYARRDQAGPIEKPVGVLVAMLKWDAECGDKRCDERTNVDTGQPCISCEQRASDKRAARAAEAPVSVPEAAPAPEPRPKPVQRPASPVPPPREAAITEVSDHQRSLARQAVMNRPRARR
ncbi:hypothetical protein [Streptomyces sp. WAC 04229]|uniref:hypothetical protein n=1 Tax=Streptomyces sp. WAC 04229 TaxID=2203206 RepID=UPI00163B779F|nr:hypothetical protein [Streptomyces sp. WAC 04229]